jgi:DNA-binding NtrC family response regulator
LTPPAVVLVVEDHALIRFNAIDLLETAGFEALEASNADEAISLLKTRADIVLVFTDVEMPGSMDGVKLAHFVRNRWPPVKLIVTSGKVIVEASHLPEGARFFPKPYNGDKMVEAVTALLADVPSESIRRES